MTMATEEKTVQIPDDPPRSPEDYENTPHYRGRIRCDRRPINRRLTRKTIEGGECVENPSSRANSWAFQRTFDGMRVTVAVGEDRIVPKLVKITAYVDVADANEAWKSDRWSKDEFMVSAMLQRLIGEHVPNFHPKRIHVTDAVPYHGHDLIWKSGYPEPYCLACQQNATTKFEWEELDCS